MNKYDRVFWHAKVITAVVVTALVAFGVAALMATGHALSMAH